MNKVSVIVAAYNAEIYIERALVSLKEQTLDSFEVIIINDGSTDNTLNLIEKCLKTFPNSINTRCISRENKGVSLSRTEGLKLSSGQYVIHMDSDDWAEVNMLESMYNAAITNNADVVICDYSVEYKNKSVYVSQVMSDDNNIELIKNMLSGELHGFSWNKLVKKDLCTNNNLNFPSEINYLEDFLFVIQVLFFSKRTIFLGTSLIHYNKENELSITKNINKKKIDDIKKAINYIEFFLIKNIPKYITEKNMNIFKVTNKYLFLNATWNNSSNEYFPLYPEARAQTFNAKVGFHGKLVLFFCAYKMNYIASMLLKFIHRYKSY